MKLEIQNLEPTVITYIDHPWTKLGMVTLGSI